MSNTVDELNDKGPLEWLADQAGNANRRFDAHFVRFEGGGSTPSTPSGGTPVGEISGQDIIAQQEGTGGIQGHPIIAGLDGGRVLMHPAGEFWAIQAKNDAFVVQVRIEPIPAPAGLP